jgi:dimethylhistidine N-methyltransferase
MSKIESVLRSDQPTDQLTAQALAGLRKSPKQLSPVWFYDEEGSCLFDSICELPEYYLTRTEMQIMAQHGDEMARLIGPHAALIEFGSGSSDKTRLLLDKLDSLACYVPIDISRDYLFEAAGLLARDYPHLRITPVCADFTQPFDLPVHIAAAHRRVVYFPGSTLGNFETDAAQRLLTSMRTIIGRKGVVLIGIDLRKSPDVLERAYNDSAGVTAEFNLNALRHINRELGADFDIDAFEHSALWVEDMSRIEMHLVSKRDQEIHLGDETVKIRRGEHLRTECCHKYTLEGFAELAANADLQVTHVWTDPERKFSVQMLEARQSPKHS